MSRNFELLQRVAKDDFFNLPDEPAPPPKKAAPAIPFRKEPPDAEITKLVQRLFTQAGKGSGPKVVSFSGIARDEIRFDPSAAGALTLLGHLGKSHFPENRQCLGAEIRNRLMRQRL